MERIASFSVDHRVLEPGVYVSRRDADAAKEALLQRKSIMEYRAAQATLARAVSRLRVKHHHTDL